MSEINTNGQIAKGLVERHGKCLMFPDKCLSGNAKVRKVREMTEDFLEARPFELVLENGLHFN